jgi:hypothetical protein
MVCDNKATIDITYNHKIGDGSNDIDVTYHLVYENVKSGQISRLQIESGENLGNIYTKGVRQVTLLKLWTTIMDGK